MTTILQLALVTSGLVVFAYGRSSEIHLVNNGYEGLVIGIHRRIPENASLIDAIKEKFIAASKQLYKSTKKRAYFKEITILLPKSWTDKPEYGQVKGELYDKADVIVASANPRHRNNPYVKTYSGCGDSGVHMHLTPEYLTDPKSEDYYGPPEKLIVHEWAHFRWGVFDEYPTDGEQEFYFSPSTGRIEPTRCTAAMKGRIWEYVDDDKGRKKIKFCRIDPILGTYPKNCHFYPHEKARWQKGLKGSIMDRQYVPGVDYFCEHNKADPKIHHNSEAPNKHNRLCRGKSTWEVIGNSKDFRNLNNLPREIPDDQLVPTFKIVRTRERRVVLVMDTSGSMTADDKLTRMNQAAEQYIKDGIDDNSELGIVEFSTSARMASPIRKIRHQGDRDILINDLVKKASGGTSIGGGLMKAHEMLKAGGGKTEGSLILLITDGTENNSPKVMDVMPQLFFAGITVDTLAYTFVADNNLAAVSLKTGGKFYYDSNDPTTTALNDAFFDLSAVDKDESNRPIQLVSEAKMMSSYDTVTSHVAIDDTLGKDTLFVISYTNDIPLNASVTSPSGVRYDESSAHYNRTSLKLIRFRFAIAETGTWSLSIKNTAHASQRLSFSVSSKPRSLNDQPITVKTEMSAIKTNEMKVGIYAEVTKGPFPVSGMTVVATVERLMATPYQLELLDNGLGADVTKNDGVYSRYFTAFTANGRYSVSVKVSNQNGKAVVQETEEVGQKASFRVSPEDPLKYIPPDIETKSTAVTSNVSRTTTAGAFEFKRNGTVAPFQPFYDLLAGKDVVPPGEINDLIVSMTSHENGTVSLSWLATGDDEDVGKAFQYDIRMAENYDDLATSPETAVPVTQAMLTVGNLTSPRAAGERERFTVKVDVNPTENASFVFAVRALDEVGHPGKFSNIATAGLGYVPDVIVVEMVDPLVFEEILAKRGIQPSNLRPKSSPTPVLSQSATPTSGIFRPSESSNGVKEPNSNLEKTSSSKVSAKSQTKSILTPRPTIDKEDSRSPFANPVVLGATIAGCSVVALTLTVSFTLLYCARAKVHGNRKVSEVPQPTDTWAEMTNWKRSVGKSSSFGMTPVNLVDTEVKRPT